MFVKGDVRDHHCCRTVCITGVHCLTDLGLHITVPDDVASLALCLKRVRQEGNHHIEQNCVQRGCLCKVLCVALVAFVDDRLQRHTGLLHVRDRDCPVVQSRTECDISFQSVEFPSAVVVEILVHSLDELVDFVNNSAKADHHLLRVNLQLIDKPVNLVDEQNRVHTLFECLTQHRLGLRHRTLNCVHNDDCAVHSTHCTGDISTKVNVARSINHVDEVLFVSDLVDHGHVGCINGDSTCLFLFVRVHPAGFAGELLADHSCSGEEVIREGGLSVVNVCYDTDVTDVLRIVHELRNSFNHLLSA